MYASYVEHVYRQHFCLGVVLWLAVSLSWANEQAGALRFGVLLPAQPTRIYQDWSPLADYLSERLGMPVEIVIPKGMRQAQSYAKTGAVDVFYVNAYVFYQLQQQNLLRPLAQVQNIRGNTMSYSTFLVRSDSPVQNIEGLRGKTVALVSRLGAGSYLAPRAYLNQHGLKLEEDVGVIYTHDMLRAAYMVMLGEVDAAVMCAVTYEIVDSKIEMGEMRLLAKTGVFPESVVAARPGMDASLAQRVQTILLQMAQDPAGQRALAPLSDIKLHAFIAYDPSVEELTQALIEAGDF